MTNTTDKLNEAHYFLDRMKETNRDKNAFRYNLGAFLSAFCSVDDSMNIEFQRIYGFIPWHQESAKEQKRNSILQFLKKKRNGSVHVEPIAPRTHQSQMNIPEIDTTKLSSFSVTAKINEDGIMSSPFLTRVTFDHLSTTEEITATTFWVFPDLPLEYNKENKDVVSLCEEQILLLDRIVQECEQTFLSK